MKFLFVVLPMLLLAVDSHAADKEDDYQQCLLEHAPKVQVAEVWSWLKHSCHQVHREIVVLPSKKAFYQCVLQHVPQVELAEVVPDVVNACARQHNFRK